MIYLNFLNSFHNPLRLSRGIFDSDVVWDRIGLMIAQEDNEENEFDLSSNLRGPLRKGKWTTQEEIYANKIIHFFNQGMLDIPAGTTLRSYLSEKLNWYSTAFASILICTLTAPFLFRHSDPMRITKKYAGASCIGKQVFIRTEPGCSDEATQQKIANELKGLEKSFLVRLFSKRNGSVAPLGISFHPLQQSLDFKAKLRLELLDKSSRPRRTASAPDLNILHQTSMQHKRQPYFSLAKRSRSLMALEVYTLDDSAAGPDSTNVNQKPDHAMPRNECLLIL